MRLFVAVDVPDELKARIQSDIVERLRPALPGARWTRPEGRHLTLKFLGNVDAARVGEIASAVGRAASETQPFDARFAQLSAFPNDRRPRVLWIGLGEGREELTRIALRLDDGFVRLGFEEEARSFQAHLTLARFPRPTVVDLPAVDVPTSRFRVTELVLFESKLNPKGARYSALERFEFS